MKCRAPFQRGDALYPCGQCIPCRINRRRVWTHRINLEVISQYQDGNPSSFVTLTYEPGHEPRTVDGLASLDPTHVQEWLKRLRRRVEPNRVRYYAVGEYGDESWRPHYHVALFGFPTCRWGKTRHLPVCCDPCSIIRDTWGHGHILLGDLNFTSAAYIAGYVTKKLNSDHNPLLQGRYREFARMSLKPGIGGDAMYEVASTLLSYNLDKDDVPGALRHGAALHPLGRYLRRRLRTFVGKPPEAPEATVNEAKAVLQPLYAYAFENSLRFKDVVAEVFAPEADQMMHRAVLRTKKKVM